MDNPIVIIGTGLAGYTLAREFRQLDATTPLILITADDGSYYSKPMLSNALARGKTATDLTLNSAEKMRETLKAEILTSIQITGIDTKNNRILTANREIFYQSLVIASGATPIQPPMEGDAAADVVTVNSLTDYHRFREKLDKASYLAIIGPGLIGCEFANDLIVAGKQVTIIGPDPHPISTLLPESVGQLFQSALGDAGVEWQLGRIATTVDGEPGNYQIRLDNGVCIKADLVLSAIGLRPETSLAEAAGLETNRGIVTDSHLRTSQRNVYALGDCAEVAGLNLPFIAPIMVGAKALAKTLTGEESSVIYPAMPVVIKTPACPLAVVPPPRDEKGEWTIDQTASGVKAIFRSYTGEISGFALSGEWIKERQKLASNMAPLIS